MQEYAVNQEFVYEGKVLKIVRSQWCSDCYYKQQGACRAPRPTYCSKPRGRTDYEVIVYQYVRDEPKITRLDLTE